MRSFFNLALVAIVGVSLASCAPIEKAPETAVQFTSQELSDYLAGNSHIWYKEPSGGDGGAYYGEDRSLQAMWDGDYLEGTYSVTDGVLCWHIEVWGDVSCETYFHDGDQVRVMYEGRFIEPEEIREGNHVDAMKMGMEDEG